MYICIHVYIYAYIKGSGVWGLLGSKGLRGLVFMIQGSGLTWTYRFLAWKKGIY